MVEGVPGVGAQPDGPHPGGLADVLHLDAVLEGTADRSHRVPVAAAEQPAVQKGGVRHVERVLQGSVQRGLEVAPQHGRARSPVRERREAEGLP